MSCSTCRRYGCTMYCNCAEEQKCSRCNGTGVEPPKRAANEYETVWPLLVHRDTTPMAEIGIFCESTEEMLQRWLDEAEPDA